MEKANKGNFITGFIGAVIGALAGVAVWIIIGKLGYISSLAALVGMVVSAKLYDAFGGPKGAARVITLLMCLVAIVAVGTFGSYLWAAADLYNEDILAIQSYGFTKAEAETLMKTEYDNLFEYFGELMEDSENFGLVVKDLLMGLLFGALGGVGVIVGDNKSRKQKKAEETAAQTAVNTDNNGNYY